MKLLFDFFPIVAFFLSYKLQGIYFATVVAMAMSIIQVIIYKIKYDKFEPVYVIGLLLIVLLGGATLLFKNPWFIKLKPTGIYWLTAIAFMTSSFAGKRPIVQRMMEGSINLPILIWHRLNYAWVGFFVILGLLNLVIAYNYDTNTWVNFKLFGGAGLTLLFVFVQALYLTKHATEKSLTGTS